MAAQFSQRQHDFDVVQFRIYQLRRIDCTFVVVYELCEIIIVDKII